MHVRGCIQTGTSSLTWCRTVVVLKWGPTMIPKLRRLLAWSAPLLLAMGVLTAGATANREGHVAQAPPPTFEVIFAQPEIAQQLRARGDGGCWVVFHDGRDFVGKRLTLLGPLALSDLGQSVPDWRRWDSAVVGPGARVAVYAASQFKDELAVLHPGERVGNLDDKAMHWRERMLSARVTCTPTQ